MALFHAQAFVQILREQGRYTEAAAEELLTAMHHTHTYPMDVF